MNDMPYCYNCHRSAEEIVGWDIEAEIEGISVEEYARQDGTYNLVSNQFCCDDCYIAIGMPSSPTGWSAP